MHITDKVSLNRNAVWLGQRLLAIARKVPRLFVLILCSTLAVPQGHAQPAASAGAFTFQRAEYSVNESGRSVTLDLLRVGGSTGQVEAIIDVTPVTATLGSTGDFEMVTSNPIWMNGEDGARSITFNINDDNEVESTETFRVSIADFRYVGADIYRPVAAGIFDVTVSIVDDDRADFGVLSLSSSNYSVDEDSGSVSVTVRRSGGSGGGSIVNLNVAPGTATRPADFGGEATYRFEWEAGENQDQSITIPIVADNDVEPDEQFTVSLTAPDGGEVASDAATATITINGSEPDNVPGRVYLSDEGFRLNEDEGPLEFQVFRDQGSDGELSLTIGFSAGAPVSATSPDDYDGTPVTVRWDDGEDGPQPVSIPIVADSNIEEDERFSIRIGEIDSEFEGVIRQSPVSAPVTILNDDAASVPRMGTVQFAQARYTTDEGADVLSIPVTRVGGDDGEILLDYEVSSAPGVSVSVEGSPNDVLRWGDGVDAPQTLLVSVEDDRVMQQSRTVTIDLSVSGQSESGGDVLGEPASTEITVIDNDPIGSPGLIEFAPISYRAFESDGEVTINATRQQGSAGEIIVDVSTINGTAIAGSDYTAASEELSWADGDTSSKSLTIELIEDELVESTERFSVRMTLADESADETSVLGNATTATVDIEERPVVEPDEPGALQFSSATYSASETDGDVELTLTRTGGSDGAVAVLLATRDGTADAGEDYEATQERLSWIDGETGSKTLRVSLNEDTLAESAETFIATLTLPAGQATTTLGTPSEATVTITDIPPPSEAGTVQFTTAAISVAEDDESVELQISRTGGQDGAISMIVQGSDGSATLGEDFQFEPMMVTWADQDDGQRSVVIPIELDNLEESAETFRVTLIADANNAQSLGTPDTVVVTIGDVSNPIDSGIVLLAEQSHTVSEAQGTVTIVVNRTGGSEGAVSVQYDTVAGTAQSPEDFASASGRLSWGNGDTSPKEFTVNVVDDAIVEDEEQFEVRLSGPDGPGNASLTLGRDSSIVTIEDSTNIGQLQFSSENYSGRESDDLVVFSVERIGGADGSVSVDYRLQGGTATAGDDYVSVSGTLNWADGDDTLKTAVVRLLTDSLREPSETFDIILTGAQPIGDEQIAQGLATIEIIDTTIPPDSEPLLPYVLTIVSGDDQSLIPGDTLDPLVLQASLEPPNNGSVENVTINWRVEPSGSAELINGNQTTTDIDGVASNQVRVLDRGFVRVLARVGQAVQLEPSTPGLITGRIAPPPVDLVDGEIVFTLRSGLFAAEGLNNNQAQTGGALDAACAALDQQSDLQSDDPMSLTVPQLDLQATCRSLESRLADGTLAPALDRLAPEELFTLGDSVIDTTELRMTNVYSRINAVRSGRTDSVDVSGLSLDIRGELIPGSVVEAAQNTLPSGGAASADGSAGAGPRFGVFANGAVSVGEVDGDDNQRDANVSTTGLTIGVDYRVSANSVIGIGLGMTNNETDFTSDEGRVDLSAVNLSLFATYYEENSGYLDVVLDAGLNQFDIERRIDLPGTERRMAIGSTDASVFALTVGAGFDKNYGTFEFGPYARLSLVNADVDGYRETTDSDGVGSGSVLAIESHSVRSKTVSIGAQASRPISTRTGVFVPQLRIEGEVELTDRKDGIRAVFQHDPSQTAFEVNGNERDTNYINIGLGSSFLLANGRSGYVFYETRAQHDYVEQHWLKLGLRLEFR